MDIENKLSSLQEISKTQLAQILSTNPIRKYLILEPPLIRPLEKVCGVRWLKGNGIEKIFKLEEIAPTFESTVSVFYVIQPYFKTFTHVLNQLRSQIDMDNLSAVSNKFHIIVVPRSLHIFEENLENYGLYDVVQLHSFQWMPIYLDTGILSLELKDAYSSISVYENMNFLPVLSETIWKLSFVTGKPQFILTLGQNAKSLLKQYDDLCEHRGDTDRLNCDFGGLIIVDRSVDYVSALLTPGIYSALLNEVYTVSVGCISEPKDDTASTSSSGDQVKLLDEKCNPIIKTEPVTLNLNSLHDNVYYDIKNRFFTEVTSVLGNLTKELKTEQVSSKEMALDEIKRYVQTRLQETRTRKKLISNHLLAAESIIKVLGHRYEALKDVETNVMQNSKKSSNFSYLEEFLATTNDKYRSLRLFCLLCITQKLSESEILTFWNKYLYQFGFKYGFAFGNLVTTGFVEEIKEPHSALHSRLNIKLPTFSKNNFYHNAKLLKQIPTDPEKVNLKHPTCASYVFGGIYIPLITQIANMLLNSIPIEEIKTKLESVSQVSIRHERSYPLQSRTLLIYVLGGVTYAEIAACNLIETLTGSKIVVLSDRVVNGNDLMNDILTPPK